MLYENIILNEDCNIYCKSIWQTIVKVNLKFDDKGTPKAFASWNQ